MTYPFDKWNWPIRPGEEAVLRVAAGEFDVKVESVAFGKVKEPRVGYLEMPINLTITVLHGQPRVNDHQADKRGEV